VGIAIETSRAELDVDGRAPSDVDIVSRKKASASNRAPPPPTADYAHGDESEQKG
jgi:hypothetical protein